MVDGEALLVALAHFGEDVDPGLGLHAVVGLDVQRALRLDDLEHLRRQSTSSGGPPSKSCCWRQQGSLALMPISPGVAVGGSGVIQKLRQPRGIRHLHVESKGVAWIISPMGPIEVDCSCYINGLVSLGSLIF